MTGEGIAFASWQGYYRDENGKRAILGIRLRVGNIDLVTASGERLRFTPLEAGLLLDGLTAAIRAVGRCHDERELPPADH